MFKMNKIINLVLGSFVLLMSAPTFAALEDINVMALGSLDGRAVVKTKDGKMKVLKVGDTVPNSKAIVKQILNDRLVVEEKIGKKGSEQDETVWIYKPNKMGAKSRIQRLTNKVPNNNKSEPMGNPMDNVIK